jgi:tRNA A-37 threonylcarbamoyl transferase component Bud32
MKKEPIHLSDVLEMAELISHEEQKLLTIYLQENNKELQAFLLEHEIINAKSLMGLKVLEQGFGSLNKDNSRRIFSRPETLLKLIQQWSADKAAAEQAAAERAAAEQAAAERAAARKRRLQYPEPGDMVGKCQLTSVLGSGATSRVYLGFHSFLRKNVAIKILSPRLVEKSSDAEARFLHEAINTAKLDHTNLVRVLDADRNENYTYMIMEYIDGPTLKELLERSGAIKPLNAIRIIQKVLPALDYAQKFHIIHRDIKPGNIMLSRNGDVKLADLGLAKIVDSPDLYQTTEMGTIHGTPYYMPPEQDSENLDFRGDMYSLGATLYHLVTGELPLNGDTIPQIIYKHLYEQPIPPQERNPEVGEALGEVILRLIAKKPEDRYPDYQSLINLFNRLEVLYEGGESVWPEKQQTSTQSIPPPVVDVSQPLTATPEKKGKGFLKNLFGG